MEKFLKLIVSIKNSDQKTKSIEKLIDKNNETFEVLFTGCMMKYTTVFNQLKRSSYGRGSDAYHNILQKEGELCYIPTANACFRKCSEYIYKKGFSNDYKEFILDSDRCKIKMTLAENQPFCSKHGLDISVHSLNSKRILPQINRKKNICLYFHKNHLCVIWKLNRGTKPLDAVVEIENSFRYEETQINYNILKQVVEYKFPITFEMNCLYNVFAFDRETCNVENSEYCESYAAGVYILKKWYECFKGDLNKEELAIDRSKVHIFDRENSNPVLKMIEYVVNNYKGKPNHVINKYENEDYHRININWLVMMLVVSVVTLY